jgi:hypothetical protein
VLPADRPAELDREPEQLLGRGPRRFDLIRVPRVDEVRRVQVAVARVTPGACDEAVPVADRDGALDRLAQPFDGNGDVVGELAAALGRDRESDRVAPAPQRAGLDCARLRAECVEQLSEICFARVGFCDDEEAGVGWDATWGCCRQTEARLRPGTRA